MRLNAYPNQHVLFCQAWIFSFMFQKSMVSKYLNISSLSFFCCIILFIIFTIVALCPEKLLCLRQNRIRTNFQWYFPYNYIICLFKQLEGLDKVEIIIMILQNYLHPSFPINSVILGTT